MGLVESVTLDSVKLTPNPPVNTNMPVFVLFEEAREPGGNPQRPRSQTQSLLNVSQQYCTLCYV